MVDEGSQDQDVLKPHSFYKNDTRRNAISQLAAWGAGFLAGGGVWKAMSSPIGDNKVSKITHEPQSIPAVETPIVASPQPTPQSVDVAKPRELRLDILLSGHPSQMKDEFMKLVNEQIKFYREKDVFLSRNIQRVRGIINEGIIEKAALRLNIDPSSSVARIMPGIIFTESKGNQFAKAFKPEANAADTDYSDNLARGLCQLLPTTAWEVARNIGLQPPVDLYDKSVNITLGLKYLSDLYSLYPEPSLAVWAYHFGPKNMYTAISKYLAHAFPNNKEIEKVLQETGRVTELVKNQSYAINLVNVLSCPPVREYFEFNKPTKDRRIYLDESDKYSSRVGAGLFLIEQES